MKYLSFGGMKEYISNFAYLGMGKCWIAIVILLVFTTLTDTNKTNFKTPIYIRILSVIFFVMDDIKYYSIIAKPDKALVDKLFVNIHNYLIHLFNVQLTHKQG